MMTCNACLKAPMDHPMRGVPERRCAFDDNGIFREDHYGCESLLKLRTTASASGIADLPFDRVVSEDIRLRISIDVVSAPHTTDHWDLSWTPLTAGVDSFTINGELATVTMVDTYLEPIITEMSNHGALFAEKIWANTDLKNIPDELRDGVRLMLNNSRVGGRHPTVVLTLPSFRERQEEDVLLFMRDKFGEFEDTALFQLISHVMVECPTLKDVLGMSLNHGQEELPRYVNMDILAMGLLGLLMGSLGNTKKPRDSSVYKACLSYMTKVSK